MQAGGDLLFYGTPLDTSLSQPRLLVSVSSTVQNKSKKTDSLCLFPEKEKEKSEKVVGSQTVEQVFSFTLKRHVPPRQRPCNAG